MDTSEPTGDTHMDSLPPINEEQLPEKDTHDRHIEDNFVAEDANGETITLTIKFPPENHNQEWIFFSSDTLWDLFDDLSDTFPSYNWSKAKALIEKRPPYLKPVYVSPTDDDLPLATLDTITLRILAPKTSALEALTSARAASAARQSARASLRARRIAAIPSRPSPQATTYTFYTLRPLPHLPNPSTALALLQRLKSDPGIRAAMQAHHFTVGLLTEMDPSQHTAASHTGVTRILGLNRNRGQVIELRLRTDAYDGWRDYRTIRKTLCHELAHNVHSEHDGKFWELCKRIEREVERADWTRGGRTVGGEGVEFAPERGGEEEEGEVVDHGGWERGEWVLGGHSGGGETSEGGEGEGEGLSARELRARAAEARMARLEAVLEQGVGGGSSGERLREGLGQVLGAVLDAFEDGLAEASGEGSKEGPGDGPGEGSENGPGEGSGEGGKRQRRRGAPRKRREEE